MAMKVPLSFKEKEKSIYDYLMDKGNLSPSVFIKQLIKNEMQKEETPQKNDTKKSDLLDF